MTAKSTNSPGRLARRVAAWLAWRLAALGIILAALGMVAGTLTYFVMTPRHFDLAEIERVNRIPGMTYLDAYGKFRDEMVAVLRSKTLKRIYRRGETAYDRDTSVLKLEDGLLRRRMVFHPAEGRDGGEGQHAEDELGPGGRMHEVKAVGAAALQPLDGRMVGRGKPRGPDIALPDNALSPTFTRRGRGPSRVLFPWRRAGDRRRRPPD